MISIDLDALQGEINRAGHGHKSAVVNRYAQSLGVSVGTIYRGLRKKFGKQKTVKRAKKHGQDLIDMVADIKITGMKLHLAERELSTERCIIQLIDRGVAGAENLRPGTVNRRLFEAGFRVRDPKRRVEPEFANQEHQIDFSRSKYFQTWKYDAVREDYLLKVSGKELHYKKGDYRLRTWLAQVKESKSRCRLIRAYAATSEDGFIGLDLLNWNFNRGEDEHCMHHLPWRIKTDRGSFSRRKEVLGAMKALEIDLKLSGRGGKSNKDSQGKVESGFRGLWQGFELDMAIRLGEGSTIYLCEYNELLHEWLITDDSQKKHPLLNDTREAVYRKSILLHPPRTIDIDVMQVACKVEKRKVTQSLMIQYENEQFEAPVYCMDKWVRIYKNMFGELMGELIEEHHKPFVLKAYYFNDVDDFSHGHKLTYRQEREIVVERESVERKAKKKDKRLYMPPKPVKVEPDSPFMETRPFDSAQGEFENEWLARVFIGEQLRYIGASYAEYEHVFDPLLADDLTRASIEQVLDAVKNSHQKMRLSL